ncbi:hypothetical protein M9Y10_025135 [Tritrichomonas musculus]|uniref:Protein kinase domain-containing protein n=1 Tax=Tritrichomonas musculus TaxID=1915356 RepID=A0ABR2HAM9_9EUKA
MKNSSKCLDFLIQCKSMINQIDNDVIQKMYSKFTFKFFSFNNQEDNEEDFIIKLFEYLKKYKFIVCNLYNLSKGSLGINVDFSVSPKTNCIFCVEDEIFIIEQINTELINKQINNQQINLIYLSQKNTEQEIRYDVRFFCARYFQAIKKNYFVKYTIQSIVCYLIRRNYYPSHYFKNSSFFEFELTKNDFDENEFITLRQIYSINDNSYFLIIHIETFHLFVMKKCNESTKKHEEQFCTNYSHPNFIRFYGFLKKNEKRIGLIYEFMSNGSFGSYIKNNKNDDMYLMFTIIRISNGIEYLHKNGLIHRDLKLSNILVDHNGIPYISDFETIRSTSISEGEFTYNFNSKYSSPEQDIGGLISFATDIFSFGRMIFNLYENDYTLTLNNKDRISPMTKGPEIAHYLYESCVQYKQEDRIKIEEINFILMKNYLSFYSLFEQYLINGLEEDYLKGKDFYDKSVNLNNSEVFLNLGNLYFNGDGVEQDYLKAKEYYEKSANLGNSDAIIQIGKLYLNGYGVKKDYLKAKDYYEKAANLKNPSALSNLGILYECGYGVEQDYMKAKELYEKAANLKNSNGINNLGYLYENGYGVKQDYVKAKEYYEKAAKLDNSNALNNLGNLYRFGHEVEQNYLTAKEYFEKAVKLNNSTAMNNLGDLYFEGDGVEQDYMKAKELYEKAANLNDSN